MSPASTTSFAVAMVSWPPSGMASRAFRHRLSMAASIWLGSTIAGHRSAASSVVTRTRLPSVLAASVTSSDTRWLRSVGRADSRCRRENASNREVSLRAALHRADGAFDQRAQAIGVGRRPGFLALRHPAFHQLQAAHDGGEHVVEVVRDAAGELADRLQLVRLVQRRLGLLAFGDFHLQAVVGFGQLAGALGDLRRQHLGVQPPFQVARLQLSRPWH